MIAFDLKFNGKIRFWFEENKDLKLLNVKKEYKDYIQLSNKIFQKKTIIAEIFLPRGGRNIYGLLGVEYKPTQHDTLKVIINRNEIIKPVLKDSLIQKIEPAFINLPDEYSQYVLSCIDLLYRDNQLAFKGELNFCYAASAEISSSGWIFSKLTKILLTILQAPTEQVDSDMIMKILD